MRRTIKESTKSSIIEGCQVLHEPVPDQLEQFTEEYGQIFLRTLREEYHKRFLTHLDINEQVQALTEMDRKDPAESPILDEDAEKEEEIVRWQFRAYMTAVAGGVGYGEDF